MRDEPPGGVVPGSFLVVLGSVLVMFGGLGMMAVRGMAVRWFLWHTANWTAARFES